MAVTKQRVIQALMPKKPNYVKIATLGPEALPFLQELVNGKDLALGLESGIAPPDGADADEFSDLRSVTPKVADTSPSGTPI